MLVLAAAAIAWIWFGWLPRSAPEGTAAGPVAEVFAEAVRTGSTDRLLRHVRSVPGTKVCVVSVQGWLRWAVKRGGANAASVPNLMLQENIWALILVRPNGTAEFVTTRSAHVSPRHSLGCLRAEEADMSLNGPYLGGAGAAYFTVAPARP